ncbi:MAG: 4Fe-4S ferredoxin [Paludibacter sp.]|nr:4Fe-4S ferredoxin [Paludibacter sp.]
MKRTIIKIDEKLCNGCESCVHGCHEGALQMIDGKAWLVSELYCDGLGTCIGDCPVGAITFEEREAEPYNEIATLQRIIPKGEKTIIAHLKHLKEHGETGYLKQGVSYLKENGIKIDFAEVHNHGTSGCAANSTSYSHGGGSCPGSHEMSFEPAKPVTSGFKMAHVEVNSTQSEITSQLRQWPVQLHLLNPEAGYFRGADVLLAADCVAFSYGNFHNDFLEGKTLAIACLKLDSNKESYLEKLKVMITNSRINKLTVLMMEVPCCGGLLGIAKKAVAEAGRKIPVKAIVVGIKGNILQEEWI